MMCLGCGQACDCAEPAKYPIWPLETTLSREGLEDIEEAIHEYMQEHHTAELENTANIIHNWLQRQPITEDDLLK
jgi:hypothetical protein